MVTTALLPAPTRPHPAVARRLARQLPPQQAHDTVVRPLGGGGAATLIATAPIDNFVEALFDQLSADDWRTTLAAMHGVRRGQSDHVLELGLPTHRKAQIVLFEVFCRQPGSPRIDPKKLADKGMVIRRVHGSRWDGWMKAPRSIAGWTLIPNPDADPGVRGDQAFHAANRVARSLVAARRVKPQFHEDVLPLHLVPPDICAKLGRTILFGVIPVGDSTRSSAPPTPINYAGMSGQARIDLVGHLSEFLKPRAPTSLPRASQALRRKWNALEPAGNRPDGTARPADQGQINALGVFLQQLSVELDAFGTSAEARALMALLKTIPLPLTKSGSRVTSSTDAATFATRAAKILIDREPNANDALKMPLEWPRIDADLGNRLTQAALNCLSRRHADLAGSPGKFEVGTDQFVVRGFVRVRGHEGCAEKLVWSAASERFRVLPWWDGDGPGIKIKLPDMSQLKRVKPNVSFEMPPAIANMLNGDLKKLADGDGKTGGPSLGFICSFSIPIITLCAFIVLNIFLGLFDLFLRWMMFIKICLPIPMPAPPEESDT